MELIRLKNITKTYHLGEIDVPVLKGISLSIGRGEMVALMGASGSGKTTLMNILGCLDRPSSGEYWLDGEEMSLLTPNERALVRTDKLGFVFQSFNLLPRTKALYQVTMPLDYSPNRPHAAVALQRSKSLLNRVGLADRADHEPSQMSGGQQQRVAIARSLVNQPALLLADEPTGNLDSHTSVEILRMFQQLNAEGISVILVTHDPKVATYAHRTIRIADGLIEGDETRVPDSAGGPAFTPAIALDHGNNGNGNGNGLHINRHPEDNRAWSGNGSAANGGEHAENGGPSDAGSTASLAASAATAIAVAERVAAQPVAVVAPAKAEGALYGDEGKVPQGLTLSSLLPPTFRTAFGALRRNKMRSALTALGVIIGVGAVIAMTGIGEGSKSAIQKQIASMGADNLQVMPGAAASGGVNFGSGSRPTLTPGDSDQLEELPAIERVAPIVQSRGQLVYGHNNWNTRFIVGTTPAYLDVRDWNNLEEGDTFTDRDVNNANKVCLIGATLKRELFEGESPINKEMRIANVSFRVIGVLSAKGSNMVGMDQDDIVVAPWTTIKYRVNATLNNAAPAAGAAASGGTSSTVNSLSSLYPPATPLYDAASTIQAADTPQNISFVTVDNIVVKAASTPQIPEAIREIKSLLRQRHHIHTPSEDDDTRDDFNVRDNTEFVTKMASQAAIMGVLLLIVAAISLIVGGVGIMNIMLVSVTERTREIGLRMAVGARSYHIMRQFLVEAVVLCLVGGAIGVFLGWGTSVAVHYIKNWPTSVSPLVVCIAVAVSAGVGIVFGFYPAWKASKLDPIEALRYE